MNDFTTDAARPATPQEADLILGAVDTIRRAMQAMRLRAGPCDELRVKAASRLATQVQKNLDPDDRFKEERAFVYSAVRECFGEHVLPPRNDAIQVFLILGFAIYFEALHGVHHNVRLRAFSAIGEIGGEQRFALILMLIIGTPDRGLGRLLGEVLRLLGLPALPASTEIEEAQQ
ncbi:hypothetical protein RA210_U10577 [Rubrivivax sp. A210]|uniref:hypothetical protein n=1 Tax=Rubrivivax sp. A210 TaxID=2772301 RepID=UPI00191A7707|nr:hypothetical protein [Rubrivivax sp. A210]CAD5366941.1 hypothetical protein RA210_U10577 [Rubrivivax sp. A210]